MKKRKGKKKKGEGGSSAPPSTGFQNLKNPQMPKSFHVQAPSSLSPSLSTSLSQSVSPCSHRSLSVTSSLSNSLTQSKQTSFSFFYNNYLKSLMNVQSFTWIHLEMLIPIWVLKFLSSLLCFFHFFLLNSFHLSICKYG